MPLLRNLAFIVSVLLAFLAHTAVAQTTAEDIKAFIAENLASSANILMMGQVETASLEVTGAEPSYQVEIRGIAYPGKQPFANAISAWERVLGLEFDVKDARLDFTSAHQIMEPGAWSGRWSFQVPQRYEALSWSASNVLAPGFSIGNLLVDLQSPAGSSQKSLALKLDAFSQQSQTGETNTINALEMTWQLDSQDALVFTLIHDLLALAINPDLASDDVARDTYLIELFQRLKGRLPASDFSMTADGWNTAFGDGRVTAERLALSLRQEEEAPDVGPLQFDLQGQGLGLHKDDWDLNAGSLDMSMGVDSLRPNNLVPYLGQILARFDLNAEELSEGQPASVGALIQILGDLDLSDSDVMISAKDLFLDDRDGKHNQLRIAEAGMTSKQQDINSDQGRQDIVYFADGIALDRSVGKRKLHTDIARVEMTQQAQGLNTSMALRALMRLVNLPSPQAPSLPATMGDLYDYAFNFDQAGFDVKIVGLASSRPDTGSDLKLGEGHFGLSFDGARADLSHFGLRFGFSDLETSVDLDPFMQALFPKSLAYEQRIGLAALQEMVLLMNETPRMNTLTSDGFFETDLKPLLSLIGPFLPLLFNDFEVAKASFESPMIQADMTGNLTRADLMSEVFGGQLRLEIKGMAALQELARQNANDPKAPGALFLTYATPLLGYVKDPGQTGDWLIEIEMPKWGFLKINGAPLPDQIRSRLFSPKLLKVLQSRLFR